MMKRGVTMIELLVVVVCMAIIIGASTGMALTAIQHTASVKASRTVFNRNAVFEDRLRSILENAYLSPTATDTNSYFQGGPDVVGSDQGGEVDPNLLAFTALSPRVPSEVLDSNSDFQTLNQTYGPEGGVTEYALSLTPIGADAAAENGLFLRKQTPADGDPSQGGYQSVLDPDIDSVSWEFYDGTEWIESWDTQQSNTPRLPAAVRVTYRRKNDETDHVFVVRLIHSDVTPDNPVQTAVAQ